MTDLYQFYFTLGMPLRSFDLKTNEVHAWLIDVAVDDSVIWNLEAVLSADEIERGTKFRFQADKRRYLVSHGALREILSSYLAIAPQRLKFTIGRYGKPCLEREPGQTDLSFNLSHSGRKALVGVARDREIGVDVELVQREFDWEPLAVRFFAPQEVAMLRGLPLKIRKQAFFACWTRKEAYLKAKGLGLQLPLQDFSVSLAPGEPAALLRHKTDPAEIDRWSFAEVRAGPEYVAAIAVEGHGWQLKSWHWPAGTPTAEEALK